MPRKTILALGATVLLAGCGSSSSSSTPAASSSSSASASSATSATPTSAPSASSSAPAIAADPSGQLRFAQTAVAAKAGKVSISFTNASSTAHNLTVQSSSGATLASTPTFSAGTKHLSVTLKAGSYTFFCSVPGHRQAGMQGTLTVSGSASTTSSSSGAPASSQAASPGRGY